MTPALLGCMMVLSGLWSALFVRRITRPDSIIPWLAVSGALWLASLCWIPFLSARAAGMSASLVLVSSIFAALLALEIMLDRRAAIESGRTLLASLRRWSSWELGRTVL